jgi:hypothetical protein
MQLRLLSARTNTRPKRTGTAEKSAKTKRLVERMRIALGDIQNFPDQTSLLNYCASNPSAEAGYAPSGQTNPQTLPCQQWPYVFGQGQVFVESDLSTTTSSIGTWLTSAMIGTIPNWLLLGGLGVAGYFFMGKHR